MYGKRLKCQSNDLDIKEMASLCLKWLSHVEKGLSMFEFA